ncbi:unnamed protein product [Gongylonema pulchrum]|uniref:E3 ubiquitin-protein ligase n=1 Tax=Gongylonema pulchrum TaxID=637853 RepID=A0A183EC66_9BILA|nr:unnamed protein product [Gongylonema pulchrum]
MKNAVCFRSAIPEDVDRRVRSLTRIVLQFSTKFICWPNESNLPTLLRVHEADATLSPYQTILLNDETHTYDSVIRALNLSVHCTDVQAMVLATLIDREGRASVRNGTYDYCARAKDEIQVKFCKFNRLIRSNSADIVFF